MKTPISQCNHTQRHAAKIIIALILCVHAISCKQQNAPKDVSIASTSFTSGYTVFYGNYYDYINIPENVVGMSLLSSHLSIDSAGYYVGTGTNLMLTDIFIEPTDTMLPDGQYTASDAGTAKTFLFGKSFDGNPIGAYMLIITETGYTTELLTDGSFELNTVGDSVFIDFNFKRANGKAYTPTFKGVLPMYDGRQ